MQAGALDRLEHFAMAATEQEVAEFHAWATAETDEERQAIERGWAGQPQQAQQTPVLTVPAGVESVLRGIVGDGIEPRQALAMLAEAGHKYDRSGKRVTALRRRAGVESTGRGRGSRWRLVQN